MCHGQVIWSSVQRANKAHRCDLCGDAIKPRRAYSKLAIKGDADEGLWSQKTCAKCMGRIELTRGKADDGDGCLVGDIEDLSREFSKLSGWKKALAVYRKARNELLSKLRRGTGVST